MFVDDDRMVWLRETDEECILVLLARSEGPPIVVEAHLLGLTGSREAVNVYGGATLTIRADLAELPADGPMVQMWKLPGLNPGH